ncbi:hypothetical protein [Ruminococcus flavefaciens]|uniref:hypothetical protein n=1 Tax=Ruminococcus flavefaciens TaxID=1265 RepID=UPI0002F50B5D|nr:hypothetical protein [Ruminococcus flavefaciens]
MKLKTKLLTILTAAVMITSAAAPYLTEAYAEEISTGNIRAADYTEDYSVDIFPTGCHQTSHRLLNSVINTVKC